MTCCALVGAGAAPPRPHGTPCLSFRTTHHDPDPWLMDTQESSLFLSHLAQLTWCHECTIQPHHGETLVVLSHPQVSRLPPSVALVGFLVSWAFWRASRPSSRPFPRCNLRGCLQVSTWNSAVFHPQVLEYTHRVKSLPTLDNNALSQPLKQDSDWSFWANYQRVIDVYRHIHTVVLSVVDGRSRHAPPEPYIFK